MSNYQIKALGRTISSAIAAANSAQTTAESNPNRWYLFFQNNSSSDLWLNYSDAAVIGVGILIKSGQAWENPAHFCPIGKISICGATVGQQFTLIEA